MVKRVLRWGSIALGLTALVLGVLIWVAPAELAVRWFADRLGPLRLQGVGGSLWQGRAEQLIAYGVALGPVQWTLDRADSFAGAPRGEIALSGTAVQVKARFAREGADWRFDTVHAELPAALLGPVLDIPTIGLRGRVVVDASEVRLRDGLLDHARGFAELRELGVVGVANAVLPGLRIEFAPTPDGAILGRVDDLGGALDIDGEIRIHNGHFVSETRLHLREPQPALAELLKFVGQRSADGGSYLRIEGQLHRIGP